ncbi:MAG: esterase/lipase family protein [Rariglobus sp.]|nr:alpha/beta hydrolase [Rariglobus sp.]
MKPVRLLCCLLGLLTVARAADTVVLLHGLGRSPLAMARVAHDLRDAGYEVRNLPYPSQRADIRTLADATLGPVFTGAPAGARIHVVTHSMGGILVRQYLHDHGMPASLGRVVMLAPPNSGSALVDRLQTWPLYRWINGPAGLQLGTASDSVPNTLGPLPPGVELGVIAGNRSLNPLFSSWLSGPGDGKVTVASTHLANESAHLTVPHSHTWLMWRTPVLAEVRAFLRTGCFSSNRG